MRNTHCNDTANYSYSFCITFRQVIGVLHFDFMQRNCNERIKTLKMWGANVVENRVKE